MGETLKKAEIAIRDKKFVFCFALLCGTVGPAEAGMMIGPGQTAPMHAAGTGSLIVDNTMNPTMVGVSTALQMGSEDGGSSVLCNEHMSMQSRAYNCLSTYNLQVMQSASNGDLELEIGVDNKKSVASDQLASGTFESHFAEGGHLFDLDRFRRIAGEIDQLNVPGLLPQQYGVLSWAEFIDNVVNSREMYGVVRVVAPLELGASGLNYFNQTAPLYQFCSGGGGLCDCPVGDIEPGYTICGKTIPAGAQIKVKGALMFDFVDHLSGQPVALENLPFASQSLGFEIELPININAANDLDGNGSMDSLDQIASLTIDRVCPGKKTSCTLKIKPVFIPFSNVPQESRDRFQAQRGVPMTPFSFLFMSDAEKYHWLMPNGYAKGWAEAFQKLGITGATWRAWGFAGPDVAGVLSEADIWSEEFEDVPAFVYTAAPIEIAHNVNISGLVYAPQAMEMEQEHGSSRQYFIGGIVVRDSFYFEDSPGSITVISSDPDTFSTARIVTGGGAGEEPVFSFTRDEAHAMTVHDTQVGVTPPPPPSPAPVPGSGPAAGVMNYTAPAEWVEIQPQVMLQ